MFLFRGFSFRAYRSIKTIASQECQIGQKNSFCGTSIEFQLYTSLRIMIFI